MTGQKNHSELAGTRIFAVQSKSRGPRATHETRCEWTSIRPGRTAAPATSRTLVAGRSSTSGRRREGIEESRRACKKWCIKSRYAALFRFCDRQKRGHGAMAVQRERTAPAEGRNRGRKTTSLDDRRPRHEDRPGHSGIPGRIVRRPLDRLTPHRAHSHADESWRTVRSRADQEPRRPNRRFRRPCGYATRVHESRQVSRPHRRPSPKFSSLGFPAHEVSSGKGGRRSAGRCGCTARTGRSGGSIENSS